MQRYKNKALCLILLIIAVAYTVLAPINAQTNPMPFLPGEKLKYELRWENIPAGETRLEIRPKKMIDGVETYHFVMTTRTTGFVDVFFKLRERVEAILGSS